MSADNQPSASSSDSPACGSCSKLLGFVLGGVLLFVLAAFAGLVSSQSAFAIPLLLSGVLLIAVNWLAVRRLSRCVETLEESLRATERDLKASAARLQQLVVTDEITSVYNRNFFDESMASECRRAVREFSPLTLMLVSPDCFAQFAERHGEPAANDLLKQLAEQLKKSVSRPGDLVARFGQEEFAFLLPSTNEQVIQLAERCCAEVRQLAIANDASTVSDVLTVSIGVATMQPSRLLTPERLVETAVLSLHQARKAGGDRYVASSEKVGDIASAPFSI